MVPSHCPGWGRGARGGGLWTSGQARESPCTGRTPSGQGQGRGCPPASPPQTRRRPSHVCMDATHVPAAEGGYLDPNGGVPAPEEVLSLVAGPPQAISSVALGSGRLQGQVHGLVAVQTVRGVVEAPTVLGPRGHPLGAAVLVGVLRGLRAALRRDRDQGFGGGPRGHGWRRLLVVRVRDSCKRHASVTSKKTRSPAPPAPAWRSVGGACGPVWGLKTVWPEGARCVLRDSENL